MAYISDTQFSPPNCALLGAAMTAGVMAIAAQKGYQVAVLLSTPAGLSLYKKLGFVEVCNIKMYIRAPTA